MIRLTHRRPALRLTFSVLGVAIAVLATGCFRSKQPRLVEWSFDPGYAALDRMLAQHATPDGLHYADIQQDPSDLKILKLELADVSREDYEAFTRHGKLAFLINAHNVNAIDRIAKAYPVESIEETEWLGSALEARDIRLIGRRWSLLELRDEIMGPTFKDSRAIFLLNWGMRGCAPLPGIAPTPDNLDELLERQTHDYIQNEDYHEFNPSRRLFITSALLERYREAIERDYTTLHLFLERFSKPDVAARLRAFPPRISFRPFDTAVNDAVELPGVFPREAASR